jgi:hypothetical protein
VKIGGDQAGLGNRYFTDATVDAEEEKQEVVDAFFASAENNFDDERRAMYAQRKKSSAEAATAAATASATNPGIDAMTEPAAAVKPTRSILSMLNNW